MHTSRDIIWSQFGAAIDMLENAMAACPPDLWKDRSARPEFWYVAYHTLFFLDFYLSESEEGFAPPAPFNLDELDPAGLLPDRVYSQVELRSYLEHGRRKARSVVDSLTEATARHRRTFDGREWTLAEMLLYSMRHVQHHAAQLNLILRQNGVAGPRYVIRARDQLT